MMRHDTLRKPSSGFPMLWRLLSAFVVGLVLGVLWIFLSSQTAGSIPVIFQAYPMLPLLGVLGRLAAARTQNPFQSGWGLGGWALFGIWLAGVLWLVLTPFSSSRESFWADPMWPLVLAIHVVLLAVGQLVVLAGVAVTQGVLKLIADTPASSQGKTGLMEHDTLRKPSSGFPMIWRLLIAFVAGLVLGVLWIFLSSQFAGSLPGFVLVLLLPLLGVLGRLAAARTNHPLQSGWGLGGWAFFGIWLAGVLWLVLTPYTDSECFPDPGCAPTIEPFWAYSLWPLVLSIDDGLLAVGQLVVLAGVAVTHFVLKQIADMRASSR